MNINDLLKNATFNIIREQCSGCANHCSVRGFSFANGKVYYTGNQCEKVYSSSTDKGNAKGVNMYAEKNKRLWNRPCVKGGLRIGIPRALGMYEDYPFWHSLFTHCGFEVVLSHVSTNELYEKGIRTIMADNICFPAKLMHGHVFDLLAQKVDRIFYPWVVFENKEDRLSGNSYNCPIVSGYCDVIKSSIDPQGKWKVPFDSPIISFKNQTLLLKSCTEYLSGLGVSHYRIEEAVEFAQQTQNAYLASLQEMGESILKNAKNEGRMVIMLTGRPYHIDPLVEHKISYAISEMGIDVVTENVASKAGNEVYEEINALSQWAYPNRIFKAAYFVATYTGNLHMVELTSFGCGPDAFILDETKQILRRFNKNLTTLKIDDINNIGSLKLRIRSLVDSLHLFGKEYATPNPINEPITTRPFEPTDRSKTILLPYFAEGYTEFISSIGSLLGYTLECLPIADRNDTEEGLKNVNNDVCYPATITIGSILRALKSGKYDPKNIAVGITQTGGQCRASNYYALLKDAMLRNGFQDIPVVSIAFGGNLQNAQPGFKVEWKKIWKITLYTMLYADTLLKLYYASVVREKKQGEAKNMLTQYTRHAITYILNNQPHHLVPLIKKAATDFCRITDTDKQIEQVGVVGEIYVKYNSFSNLNIVQWLINRGVEVVPPALSAFFLAKLPNILFNQRYHIKPTSISPIFARLINRYIMHVAHKFDSACSNFKPYRPFVDIYRMAEMATKLISPAADFGEGWTLPGEISLLAHSGVKKIVSVQPFGCIANHIISKGIEKRIMQTFPDLSLLFLDFDSGTSETNIQNRLYFMLYGTH